MTQSGGNKCDVLIVGGGLHGCSLALFLARLGVNVTIIERDYVGRHASGVNAGGVRLLNRAIAEVSLSMFSMDWWDRIEELVDDTCDFQRTTGIRVAETERDLDTLNDRVEMMKVNGFEHEILIGQQELWEMAPALSRHCLGALMSARDGSASPFRTVTAFRRAAERCGVAIREGVSATVLERAGHPGHAHTVLSADGERFQAPVVVNCCGAWSGNLVAQCGEHVPLKPVGLMLMVTDRRPFLLSQVVGSASRPLSFKQMKNGTIVIGGTLRTEAYPNEGRTDIEVMALAKSARTVRDLFPAMGGASIVRAWGGIEGETPDHLPIIGCSSTVEGVYHAFGFSAHGFQLAPAVGQVLAELIVKGKPPLSIDAFSISRFDS